jgi:hypothetical protein
MTPDNPSGGVSTTRRRFLAASGATLVAATAGCSALADFVGDQVLDEVNVFNQTDRSITGSIEVVGPGSETALDDTFDLISATPDGEEDGSNVAAYGDVWTETGSYEVRVSFEGTEIDGTSQASDTVTIQDTDEEMLGIALGAESEEEPIAFRVGESFTELGGE